MLSIEKIPASIRNGIKGVFTDIDDTLTTRGRLTAQAYSAMARLYDAGFIVVPITGRPAGWCDHIARMWPVSVVVGENGAFYFRYDHKKRKMTRRFLLSERERQQNRERLRVLADTILKNVPGSALASDQSYRDADLAIDYCEDVAPLGPEAVDKIVSLFEQSGAKAKVSSIHVNGWFGDYDKLGMTRTLMQECFNVDLDSEKDHFVFIGDSPNDGPMFDFFPHSVGVANIKLFEQRLKQKPTYITERECGAGFAEVVELLANGRVKAKV